MINESGLEFKNISTEEKRIYEWESGATITIAMPEYLNVSPSGGHRILDHFGVSHYIPSGWIHLSWTVFENAPNFVK